VPTTTKTPTYKPTSIFNDTYTLAPFDKKLSAASFSLKLDINLNNIDDLVLKTLKTELATKFNVSPSRIVIWGMRAGSVIVDGGVLPASSTTEKSALEVASAISTATWNDGSMSYKVESVPAPVAPAEGPGSSLGLTVALAVIGVLAVVAIVAVVIVRKRKSHRRSTHHAPGSEMRNVTSHHHHHREEKNTGVC